MPPDARETPEIEEAVVAARAPVASSRPAASAPPFRRGPLPPCPRCSLPPLSGPRPSPITVPSLPQECAKWAWCAVQAVRCAVPGRTSGPDEAAATGQRRNIPTACSPHPDGAIPPMALSAVHRLASAVSPCLSLRVSTLLPRVPGSAKKFCFRLLSSGWPSPASMTSRPDRCLLARESGPIHPAAAHGQDRTLSGQTIHPFSSLFRS